jgi:GNAT superfamily N-acetyltransferase
MESESTRRHSPISIRRAEPSDAQAVVELIAEYAQHVFARQADVTAEALLGDGFGSVLEFFVAEGERGELCGFAAWEKTYDIITGRRGGLLLGQFVVPAVRGRGVGDRLLHAVANEVRSMGGAFLGGLGDEHAELTSGGAPAIAPQADAPYAPTPKHLAADLSTIGLASVAQSLRPRM